ncbi:hypothetical protein [Sorangium sp. So ce1024]|uniref:hypothetical protein n=1 Tax=Sorangium sp. So ce1024 TaxID=3133327 RepID=UPI003F12B8A2
MTEQQRIEATEAALRAAMGLLATEDSEPLEIDDAEYDAVEHGWDGDRAYAEWARLPTAWFDLGARLAAEFGPVAASSLEEG